MKTRKIVLSALVVVLLCIYIVQLIVTSRSPIKQFDLKAADAEDIQQITLVSAANGQIVLNKQDGAWLVTEDGYKTEESLASDIAESLAHVKTLGTVSHSSSEETLQRFGLDNNTVITVTAFKDGKAVRTLYIGKAATAGDQTYLRLDNKSDIYLASGSLRDTFGRTADALRSKEIYALNTDELTSIHVNGKKGAFTANKALAESGAVWTLAAEADSTVPASDSVDSAKVNTWATQIATLSAQSWADKNTVMPTESEGRIELTAGTNRVSVVIAKIGSGDDEKYLCASSETPYLFYVTKTVADRLTKAASDFAK